MRRKPAAQRDTRQEIADALCAKVRTMPLSKIRIAELIAELGINRNTFYYYFSSKYDVAAFAFRKDMDERLRNVVPASELMTCAGEDDPFDGLAFYACKEIGARRLSDDVFCNELLHCVLADLPLYRNLFTFRELEFLDYAKSLWFGAYAADVEAILDGRFLDRNVMDILVINAVDGLVGVVMYAISHAEDMAKLDRVDINPFRNYPLESLHHALTSITSRRAPNTSSRARTIPTFTANERNRTF